MYFCFSNALIVENTRHLLKRTTHHATQCSSMAEDIGVIFIGQGKSRGCILMKTYLQRVLFGLVRLG